MSFLKSPLALRIARVASVLVGLSALGGIVILAHRDANPPPLPSGAPIPAEKVANDAPVNQSNGESAVDSPAVAELPSDIQPPSISCLLPVLLDPKVFPTRLNVPPADRYLPSSKSAVVKPDLLIPVQAPVPVEITFPADTYIPSSKSAVVRPKPPTPPAQKSQ